ncbi:hypothetical protein RvY_09746-2 [Ramazzottius varieornatus]|uniref:Uncharacterized protein n=1 Tax=Ramazzottius varieornatus TaxID=947166 RepID=A0A1D1VAG8_RAMVA|nr:hypothetical protein RvY_09746-2 [Ramazzottius varieornatus]
MCYPVHPLTRLNLGVALWWAGEPSAARVMFEVFHTPKKPSDTQPEPAEGKEVLVDELLRIHAYAGLGITLFATSQHARALGILEAVANSAFADAYFFLAFGFIRLAMKKPRDAGHSFAKACNLEKFNMEIRFLIGGIYLLFSSANKVLECLGGARVSTSETTRLHFFRPSVSTML